MANKQLTTTITNRGGDWYNSSEVVSSGHPDKICDQISDAILDACLKQDRDSRVAIETGIKDAQIFVFGELTTKAEIDIERIAKEVASVRSYGTKPEDFKVFVAVAKQSPDIAQGVDGIEGAGDQGVVFGYATDETKFFMPRAFVYARAARDAMIWLRVKNPKLNLGFDLKTQVTLKSGSKVAHTLIVSNQIDNEDPENIEVIKACLRGLPFVDEKTDILFNFTGKFRIGGSFGDAGLTGRKIIVDTYGCFAHHGGGAFSGKDPSKVDRSGAYYARYIAKNVVASGYAKECEISFSYCIGNPDPIALTVDTFGTGQDVTDAVIADAVVKVFPLRVGDAIAKLKLRDFHHYETLAANGHFGTETDLELEWERTDKAAELADEIKSRLPLDGEEVT